MYRVVSGRSFALRIRLESLAGSTHRDGDRAAAWKVSLAVRRRVLESASGSKARVFEKHSSSKAKAFGMLSDAFRRGFTRKGQDDDMDIGQLMTLQGTIFLLAGVGIFIRKKNLLPEEATGGMLTDLLIDVILPCNIALSFRIDIDREILANLGTGFLVAWVIQAVAWALSRALYRRHPDGTKQVLQYATVCSNGGFMGSPIAESVFGSMGLMYSAVFLIPQRIVMWSAGLTLFTEAPDKKTLAKKVLTHPCIIAVFVGMFLMLADPPLPAFLENAASALGAAIRRSPC